MTLNAITHKADEGGFWAEVPALPGCLTQGETLAEVKTNLGEAIDLAFGGSRQQMQVTRLAELDL